MSSLKWLRRPWRWPLEILLISVFMTESGAQHNSSSHSCYFPSGIISAGKPCHPNAKNSGCCGAGFECLSNGVCQTTPAIDTTYKYSLYRSGCTDPTFQDPACPRFCFGEDDNPQAGQGLQVCSPESGTYCCKRDYDCCTNSTLVYVLGKPDIVTIIPNHTAHQTQSHAPTATTTHPAMPTDARQSTAYARDTIIGVGAGFAAAMAILILGCCFWLTRRRTGDRYRDRKSGVFEMDTLDGSRLAIHKEVSVSVSQIETLSPPIELDRTARLELDTRRAAAINEVVEMFELDASPSDGERRPDGTLAHEGSREELSWDENPSLERRALVPDIPILEAPLERTAVDIVPTEWSAPEWTPPSTPGSDSPASATASRPVSDLYISIAGRVETPIPTVQEAPTPIPPMPTSSASILPTPENPAPERLSMERTPHLGSESAASEVLSHISTPKADAPERTPTPPILQPNIPASHVPVPERPAPEQPTKPD